MRAWSPIWGWYKKQGMVTNGVGKSWGAAENTVWENASRWFREHDKTDQQNNARNISCTENCILAQEDILWHWENDRR